MQHDETEQTTPPTLLGVVKNITNWFSVKDLFVFSDCMVLTKGSVANTVFQATGAQFGAVGSLVGRAASAKVDASRLAKVAPLSPQALAARNKKNRLIRTDEVVSGELKKRMTSSRLLLSLADGTHYKLEWMNNKNNYPEVQNTLRQALGTKLQS